MAPSHSCELTAGRDTPLRHRNDVYGFNSELPLVARSCCSAECVQKYSDGGVRCCYAATAAAGAGPASTSRLLVGSTRRFSPSSERAPMPPVAARRRRWGCDDTSLESRPAVEVD